MTASSVVIMNSGRIRNDGNSGIQLYPVEIMSPHLEESSGSPTLRSKGQLWNRYGKS